MLCSKPPVAAQSWLHNCRCHILQKGSERFLEGAKKIKRRLAQQAPGDVRGYPRYPNWVITGIPDFTFERENQTTPIAPA